MASKIKKIKKLLSTTHVKILSNVDNVADIAERWNKIKKKKLALIVDYNEEIRIVLGRKAFHKMERLKGKTGFDYSYGMIGWKGTDLIIMKIDDFINWYSNKRRPIKRLKRKPKRRVIRRINK